MPRLGVDEYLDAFPDARQTFRWAHARQRLAAGSEAESLTRALRALRARHAPQVLYANTEAASHPSAFSALCALLEAGHTWAVNVGEAHLTPEQCRRLQESVARSQVAFMFVERNFVGPRVVRELKDTIRERRRRVAPGEPAPWLLGPDAAQNRVVMGCTAMWWPPWALGRNKAFLLTRQSWAA